MTVATIHAPREFREPIARTLALLEQRWRLRLGTDLYVVEAEEWWPGISPHLNPLEFLSRWPFQARDRAVWDNSAACALSLRRRGVVLLKPPHAWKPSGIGTRLFVPCNQQEQLRRNLCHEVTHIVTAHLKLPFWLNEGLAMLATDEFAGMETVKPETRPFLHARREPLQDTSALSRLTADEWLTAYAQAYWMTRTLAEKHPTLLRERLIRSR